ncbi:glycosyltransferase family 4 protein [Dactylosporangium sp. NBC_01737]|uniref:glycosyltransferase family 4 protein n=1 Tax=Dactylosporangium sp. NBC_01737 TaxID=2975959 RepID=UPI002E10EC04|nr:glycosyltransferase family 4 protein [Dactylosporangium sp. NBC_01737]
MRDAASAPHPADSLRIALLTHRGNPYTGGQGVYVSALSRELARLGHRVHLISGPPYPDAAEGVTFTQMQGLDLYRDGNPRWWPSLSRVRGPVDALEWATLHCWGVYPEALAFSLRAQAYLRRSGVPYDIVHDNADLGYGLLRLRGAAPVVATIHHPATVDRDFDVAAERGWHRRLAMRHWYGFTRMQGRVARRISGLATVSWTARDALVDAFGVPADRVRVIEAGVDAELFAPPREARVPGRVVAVVSSEGPLKGVADLLEAVARLHAERRLEVVLVASRTLPGGATQQALERLGLRDVVRVESRLTSSRLAALVGSAQVAVVPSRYEGFSLPAVEAMATATPLVVTTAGAIPEIVGAPGTTALHVPPADPVALAAAMRRLLDDPDLGARLGAAGRARVLERYTWQRTAARTADWYRETILSRAAATRRR